MKRRLLLVALACLALQAPAFADSNSRSAPGTWSDHSVRSKDGTRIVYHERGKGPPLIIVHGGWSTASAYKPLGDLLASDFKVVLLERRNYGVSDTGPTPHRFERDGEDVQAVIRAIGKDSFLFGHSGGALASLYAVRESTQHVKRLALYEPPVTAGGAHAGEVLQKYTAFVAEKKYEDAVRLGLTDIVGYPAEEAARRAPLYIDRLSPAMWSGAARDVEGLSAMNTDTKQWSRLTLPVLFIVGEKSNEHPLLDSTRALKASIPHAQQIVLPGQEHSATLLAPDLVADALRKFFAP